MSYTVTAPARTVVRPRTRAVRAERLDSGSWWLAALITSWFYCLPLGRYEFAGVASDFRIYDFLFIGFVLFTAGYLPRVHSLLRDRSKFFYWARLLVVVSILSLAITAYNGGMSLLPAAIIRTYRWTAYLITPVYIAAIARTPEKQRFLIKVLYGNIVLQAGLAFFQGLHLLPNLWPLYWQRGYSSGGDFPVGTLALHHKHIGVVMMIGVAMSMTLIRSTRLLVGKAIFCALLVVMVVVTIFAGIRTAWLGLLVFGVAYLFIHRARALPVVFTLALAGGGFWWVTHGFVDDPMQDKLNTRLVDRYQRFGIQGITRDRAAIWAGDLPSAIAEQPYVLIIGSGFQGFTAVVASKGAHNNYLQAWIELGILGLLIYLRFLSRVLRTLKEVAKKSTDRFQRAFAQDMWALFIGIMATMMFGETLWAQYSVFTLSGQIMAAMAIAACPVTWLGAKPGGSEVDARALRVRP